MQTRMLRTLVKIAKVASFQQAAEELSMTLSAVSMQMKTLEADLGVALFDRSVRPPRLTPMAHSIVEEAVGLLRREDALVEICRPHDDLVGRFKLGFVTSAAVRMLPPFLKAAQSDAPRATFEVETGLSAVLQDKVLSGQLDAAVVTDTQGLPPRMSTHLLQREPFVFAAHQALLSNGVTGLMADHTFLHFRPETGIGKLIAGAMVGQARPRAAKTIVLDDLETIMGCVAAGLGFTLLPVPDVARYMTPQVETREAPEGLERKLVLATSTDGELARREATFAALFRAA